MKRTVFKVILRKSEYKEQWSLLIESFPEFYIVQTDKNGNIKEVLESR